MVLQQQQSVHLAGVGILVQLVLVETVVQAEVLVRAETVEQVEVLGLVEIVVRVEVLGPVVHLA